MPAFRHTAGGRLQRIEAWLAAVAKPLFVAAAGFFFSLPACGGGATPAHRNESVARASSADSPIAPLLAHWSFSEGQGQVVHDSSGHGLDGTLGSTAGPDANDPAWSSDGPSLVFSPTTYVHVPASSAIVSAHVTVEMWMKDSAGSGAYALSVGAPSSNGIPDTTYGLLAGAMGIEMDVVTASTIAPSPSTDRSIWDGSWHHLAGTYDGSAVRLFIDGNQLGSGTPASGDIQFGSKDVWIGGRPDGAFTGSIEDVRIYGEALDPATILAHSMQRLSVPAEIAVPADTILPRGVGEPVQPPLGNASLFANDMGEARYRIPIWVPPGRAGIQPDLALEYASGAGNGLLGVGWRLTGLPRITKCRASPADSSAPPPFDYGSSSTYCLNGEPILSADGTNFHTFRDDHSVITAFRPNGPEPDYFQQRTKDGRILTYGRTPTGLVQPGRTIYTQDDPWSPTADPSYSWVRFAWLLSRVEDRAGNFYTVLYQIAGEDHLPSRIDYTGSSADPTTHRSVRFIYDWTRPDVDEMFLSGVRFTRPLRLSAIEVSAPNPVATQVVRVYQLHYTTSPVTSRSLLSGVDECDSYPSSGITTSTTPLCRSATFGYSGQDVQAGDPLFDDHDTGIGNIAYAPTGQTPPPQITVLDLNGDGMDDILYQNTDAPWTYHLRLSNGTGFGGDQDTGIPVAHNPSPGSEPHPFDFNGDGRTDLLVDTSPTELHGNYIFTATQSNGAWSLVQAPWGDTDNGSPQVEAADLNGDHYPDLVAVDDQGLVSYNLFDPNGPPASLFQTRTPFVGVLGKILYYADVNGDGRTDVVMPSYGALPTPTNPNNPTAAHMGVAGVGLTFAHQDSDDGTSWDTLTLADRIRSCIDGDCAFTYGSIYRPYFADFNGDGLVDAAPVMFQGTWPGHVSVAFNTGQGFLAPKMDVVPSPCVVLRSIDLNLDGKKEFIAYDSPYVVIEGPDDSTIIGCSTDWFFSTFSVTSSDDPRTGTLSFDPLSNLPHSTALGTVDGPAAALEFQVLDANGDGLDDFVAFVGAPDPNGNLQGSLHLFTRRGGKPDLLTSTNGTLGPATRVTYKPAGTYYGPECKVPIHCVNGRMWVVDTTSVDNGVGGMSSYQHAFEGGMVDLARWGFLGFESHQITDLQTQSITTRQFNPASSSGGAIPFYPLVGLPTDEMTQSAVFEERTRPHGADKVLRRSSKHTDYLVQGSGPFTVVPAAIQEDVVDVVAPSTGGTANYVTRKTIQQSFDPYGNLLIRQEQWPLDAATVTPNRTTVVTYQNITDPSVWLVSLPKLETVTTTAASGESTTTQTAFEFDANGLLFRRIDDPGAANGSSYDPLPPQPDGIQTVYTQYTRNANGLPIRVETRDDNDGNGLRRFQTTNYDSLEGMFPALTRDALDHTLQTAYHPGLGVVAVRVDENGLTTRYQYDTFGRIRAEHRPAGDDRMVSYPPASGAAPGGEIADATQGVAAAVTMLDSLGRETQSLRNYRTDGKIVVVTTEYDAQGHVRAKSNPYFWGATPVQTLTDYDPLGRVSHVKYPDGADVWYAQLGTLTKVMGPASDNLRFIVDDSQGRAIQSSQQVVAGTDSGSVREHHTLVTLQYGPFDTPETVTDTAGNIVRTIYDRRGRPRIKLDPDAGGAREFGYDVFGEKTDDIRGGTWDGTTFSGGEDTRSRYDAAGRLTSQVGPHDTRILSWDTAAHGIGKLASASLSGITTTFAYDTLSRLASKTWAIPSMDTTTIAYGYDAYNRPSTITYPPVPGAGVVVVRNSYGTWGQLASVSSGGANLWSLEDSDASERFKKEKLYTGIETTSTEDAAHPGWLSTIVSTAASGNVVQNLEYHWDAHARLRERDDHVQQTTERFDYDGIDRLLRWSWTGAVGARAVRYDHDDIGNLLAKVVESGPGTTVSYAYDSVHFGPHQPCAVAATACQVSGSPFAYDMEGRQTSAPGRTVAFDGYDLPVSVTTSDGTYALAYDGELHRAMRKDPSGATTYSFDGIYEVRQDDTGTHHIFTLSALRPFARADVVSSGGFVQSSALYFLLPDHQGTVDTLVDAYGNPTHLKYEPFGARVQPGDPSQPVTDSPDDVRIGFTGHEHDDGMGLIDMRGRVYDPAQQRFLSEDPAAAQVTNSQGLNPYAYVFNNPLNWTDPTGLDGESDEGGDSGEGDSNGEGEPNDQQITDDLGRMDEPSPTEGTLDIDPVQSQNQDATQGFDGQSGPYSASVDVISDAETSAGVLAPSSQVRSPSESWQEKAFDHFVRNMTLFPPMLPGTIIVQSSDDTLVYASARDIARNVDGALVISYEYLSKPNLWVQMAAQVVVVAHGWQYGVIQWGQDNANAGGTDLALTLSSAGFHGAVVDVIACNSATTSALGNTAGDLANTFGVPVLGWRYQGPAPSLNPVEGGVVVSGLGLPIGWTSDPVVLYPTGQ